MATSQFIADPDTVGEGRRARAAGSLGAERPTGEAGSGEGGSASEEHRLAILHAEHAEPLLRFLINFTGGERYSAEDMLQETMLRAWRHIGTVPDDREGARRWLFTVARRIAIDAIRMRQARPAEVDLRDSGWLMATEDTTEAALAAHAIFHAFNGLSKAHRAILSELYLRGRSIEDTATLLGVPVGTVKSRAHYALRSLRAAISAVD